MLPSKTAPKTKHTKSTTKLKEHEGSSTHPKKKSRQATVEEVEDVDSPNNISARNRASAEPSQSSSAAHEASTSTAGKGKKVCFFTMSERCTHQVRLEVQRRKTEPSLPFLWAC